MNRTGEATVDELMARIAALQAENRQLTERVVKLEEELALARLHRFAPRSEKHIDRLFNEAEQVADEADTDDEEGDVVDLPDTGLPSAENATGKKRGRRPLPENLPRERVEYDLPDDQKSCPCCRHQMHRMGEIVTEQLHIEVKAKVLQNARLKYACRHCDRTGINTPIVTAPMPAQPLPGSIATASTLAFALVHKYVDGTPLYRLAQAFERAGVPISRGTLGHWAISSSEKHLSRIYDALKLRLRSQPLIHGDETTVQVLKEENRAATDTSYMWAYRSGEESDEPIVLLDYQPGCGQIHPQTFLGNYRGIVMSDGHSAWRTLAGATHLGCMAHSRRRFVDALKARKKGGGPPEQALKLFEQLYRVERQARAEKQDESETQADCIRHFRQQHSIPVLNALKKWLDEIAPKVLPDSKLGDAVSYTLNQWDYLTRYVEDGRMPIDNNLLERDIRVFATGRKSWLFSDTVEGARASAVIYSLMLTCRACSVEPLAWLRRVLTELPRSVPKMPISTICSPSTSQKQKRPDQSGSRSNLKTIRRKRPRHVQGNERLPCLRIPTKPTETRAKALLGMGSAGQHGDDQAFSVRPDFTGPAAKAIRRPVGVAGVSWAVLGVGAVLAAHVSSLMGANALAAIKDFHGASGDVSTSRKPQRPDQTGSRSQFKTDPSYASGGG